MEEYFLFLPMQQLQSLLFHDGIFGSLYRENLFSLMDRMSSLSSLRLPFVLSSLHRHEWDTIAKLKSLKWLSLAGNDSSWCLEWGETEYHEIPIFLPEGAFPSLSYLHVRGPLPIITNFFRLEQAPGELVELSLNHGLPFLTKAENLRDLFIVIGSTCRSLRKFSCVHEPSSRVFSPSAPNEGITIATLRPPFALHLETFVSDPCIRLNLFLDDMEELVSNWPYYAF